MDRNRPKRRKDKYNPYHIYEKKGHFYISFEDGQNKMYKMEISKMIFDAFDSFELEDLVYLNVLDRHIEQSEVWETTLTERAIKKEETVEDIVFRNYEMDRLRKAIEKLPEVQKRRLIYYFFDGMSYEQIAEMEQCTYPAVIKSVKIA